MIHGLTVGFDLWYAQISDHIDALKPGLRESGVCDRAVCTATAAAALGSCGQMKAVERNEAPESSKAYRVVPGTWSGNQKQSMRRSRCMLNAGTHQGSEGPIHAIRDPWRLNAIL